MPDDDNIDMATPPRRNLNGDIQSNGPKTFTGDRGGPAEDEELLAELRAISNKSAGTHRFESESDMVEQNRKSPPKQTNSPKSNGQVAETHTIEHHGGIKTDLPQTFQGDRGGAAEDAELLAELRAVSSKSAGSDRFGDGDDHKKAKETKTAAPTSQGIKSDLPNTFQGERGGAAEDAELLAELQAISSRSGASDRFGSEQDVAATVSPTPKSPPKEKSKSRPRHASTPPWKKKGSISKSELTDKPAPEVDKPAPVMTQGGIKSDLPNTFQGERGGSAEDAELLAELRAISNSAGGASRFAKDENDDSVPAAMDPLPKKSARPSRDSTPPWKKNKKTSSKSTTSSEKGTAEQLSVPSGGGFKTDLPNTFQGERGGAAEDAELLAELRAISNGASSASRFSDEASTKQPGPVSKASKVEIGDTSGYGIKSDLPNTFKGERGGAAEDAELLAELRAISAGAGSSRFSDEPTPVSPPKPKKSSPPSPVVSKAPSLAAMTPPGQAPSQGEEEVVTVETLGSSIGSKNWKLRSQSYELLKQLLEEKLAANKKSRGKIQANSIYNDMDNMVASMVEDTNVGALDKALDFAILYADACIGAAEATRAASIVSSLTKKNGLSSRPTTTKLAFDLVMMLVEVGRDSNASSHAVVEVLINEGLKSKKPKVVLNSATLIYEIGTQFGVTVLPLHLVEGAILTMLGNANAKVREVGLSILAELCRALSKESFGKITEQMKSAQVTELDSLLSKQADPTQRIRRLRCSSGESSSVDATGSSTASAPTISKAELEAQRYASRPAVDLIAILPKTEYPERIQLAKWSEKVAALKAILDAGGEKPYKLVQSANYSSLISEMKALFSHTHFAVVTKALEVLAMLAEGVGEKVFPQLRPLLLPILKLFKDKKLTKVLGTTVDSFFGNVLSLDHLVDKDDAVPAATNEKKEKNILTRKESLNFLVRSVRRSGNAGPRSSLTARNLKALLHLAKHKLDDSDASVRKEALEIFTACKEVASPDLSEIVDSQIDDLETSHTRAFKTLSSVKGSTTAATPKSTPSKAAPSPKTKSSPAKVASGSSRATRPSPRAAPAQKKSSAPAPTNADGPTKPPARAKLDLSTPQTPYLEDGVMHLQSLRVPELEYEEEDGGILAGLSASKWTFKNDAIKKLTTFIELGHAHEVCQDVGLNTNSTLIVVREHTRGFKETNVNIMKSILQLYIEVCYYHEQAEVPLDTWAMVDGVNIAIGKMQDRKLTENCQKVLTLLCAVCQPSEVLARVSTAIDAAKSPLAHEHTLSWFKTFLVEFGVMSLGQGLADVTPWLIEESAATNPKIKKEVSSIFAELHRQLGPTFRALALQLCQGYNKDMLELCFENNPYDPNEATIERARRSIVESDEGPVGDMVLDVPKTDLSSVLKEGIIERLKEKEGKTSWKIRKEAIEEVLSVLKNCSTLVDASSQPKMKFLVDMAKALKDRLVDTQINLRPLAARTMGELLANLDKSSQEKIGKIAFPPLLFSAINDIKKPMRDAATDAMQCGVKTSNLEGSQPNIDALVVLFSAFSEGFNENATRATGMGDILVYLQKHVQDLPDFMPISLTVSHTLGEKFSASLVECLTSSKSEIRSSALALIEKCIDNNVITFAVCNQCLDKMKPAKQRTVGPMLAKLGTLSEKENLPSSSATRSPSRPNGMRSSRSKSSVTSSKASVRSTSSKSASSQTRAVQKQAQGGAASRHPLVSRTSKGTKTRPVSWCTFPEEPDKTFYSNLKKTWSAALPALTAAKLFPAAGIRKQDDAIDGCEVLCMAIDVDLDDDVSVVDQQMDCVLKWIGYILCCKEAPIGLQSLLGLVQKLFDYMLMKGRQLSPEETSILAPYLIEKAANAKGRFREEYMEITALLQNDALLSPKILGSIACVAVFERSVQARARALGFSMCRDCVATAGLSGIGRKGTVLAADQLSKESLTETKSAALDLMEEVVLKMDGDINRLVKICGSSLSDQARLDIEDRIRKASMPKESSPQSISRQDSNRSFDFPVRTPDRRTSRSMIQETPEDELPALSLREKLQGVSDRRKNAGDNSSVASGPFAFSSSPSEAGHNSGPMASSSSVSGETFATNGTESFGTAASLRARLLKIKQKNQEDRSQVTSSKLVKDFDDITQIASEGDPREEYKRIVSHIKSLLHRRGPLQEDDADITLTTRSLKKVHTALTSKTGDRAEGAPTLKSVLVENLSACVNHIMSVMAFSLECMDASNNSRISIPLLSVCLATLMALFRFPDVAGEIQVNNLTALIRETATILLDERFSSNSELDDATCAQMAKAINKTAVNAANGAPRHVSIEALFAVQQGLAREAMDLPDEAQEFNGRLSRIIGRLFGRLVKAEEAVAKPYSNVDMETVVAVMCDALDFCEQIPCEACKTMASNLVDSIVKSQKSVEPIRRIMASMDIPASSPLTALIDSVAPAENARSSVVSESTPASSPDKKGPSVADLVTALGNSREGPERAEALAALRRHQAENGNEKLDAYLEEVSPAFRTFIKDQLASGVASPSNSEASNSMSERLRKLRSRLQATDLTISTSVEEIEPPVPQRSRSVSTPGTPGDRFSTSRPPSRLAMPSPSKAGGSVRSTSVRSRLAQPSPSRARSSATQGLRDRLGGSSTSSRGTAAANLRARLEAVKQKQ